MASLRTFSKAASLAACGWVRSSRSGLHPLLNRIRQPFNVNSVPSRRARRLGGRLPRGGVPAHDRGGGAFLTREFTAMKLKYAPSRANFILVDVGRSASEVFHWL